MAHQKPDCRLMFYWVFFLGAPQQLLGAVMARCTGTRHEQRLQPVHYCWHKVHPSHRVQLKREKIIVFEVIIKTVVSITQGTLTKTIGSLSITVIFFSLLLYPVLLPLYRIICTVIYIDKNVPFNSILSLVCCPSCLVIQVFEDK